MPYKDIKKRRTAGKKYWENNKDEINARRRASFLINKDKILLRNKIWLKNNPDKVSLIYKKQRINYQKNKEKILADHKVYWKKNREKLIARHKIWAIKNIEKIAIKNKIWRKNNQKWIRDDWNNRLKTDIQFRLQLRLRSRFGRALKNNYKVGSAVFDLGCSIKEFKIHLEKKFQSGMTWKNYGLYGWHIDHKIPLSSFDLTNREQVKKACHYTNLQPMWALDNLKKNKKIYEY
mgnify:CR=1 FL=1